MAEVNWQNFALPSPVHIWYDQYIGPGKIADSEHQDILLEKN